MLWISELVEVTSVVLSLIEFRFLSIYDFISAMIAVLLSVRSIIVDLN